MVGSLAPTSNKPNLKARLIEVAKKLLVEHRGVKLPTMRQIASAADVAPGAAYRHFASQEELFIAVVTELFTDLESTITGSIKNSRDARNALQNIAQSYVTWGIENPGGYQLLFETTDKDDFLQTGQRPGLHLLEEFAQFIPITGGLKSQQLDRMTMLWVSLHGLVSLRIHKTGMPWPKTIEQDVDELVSAFLRV